MGEFIQSSPRLRQSKHLKAYRGFDLDLHLIRSSTGTVITELHETMCCHYPLKTNSFPEHLCVCTLADSQSYSVQNGGESFQPRQFMARRLGLCWKVRPVSAELPVITVCKGRRRVGGFHTKSHLLHLPTCSMRSFDMDAILRSLTLKKVSLYRDIELYSLTCLIQS